MRRRAYGLASFLFLGVASFDRFGGGRSLPLQAEAGAAVPDAARPLACRTLNASLEALLAEVAQCQTDAEFLAQLGFLLNAQGRYTEALDHLERALMLNPGLKGAQIDYAVAPTGD